MRNKTISITDKLFDLLKKEENASLLIQNLLNDYYKNLEVIKEEVIEKESIINVMENSVKEQDKETVDNRIRNSILEEVERQNKEIAEANYLLNNGI